MTSKIFWKTKTGVAVSAAIAVRLFIWALIPSNRFASDENNYYYAGEALAGRGLQDTFFPPLVGWMIAALKFVFPSAGLRSVRLVWVLMDLAVALLVGVIARRVLERSQSGFLSSSFPMLAVLAYLFYMPAISFSQFATSETPAGLLMLAVLVCLTGNRLHYIIRLVVAGLLASALVLARPNLAGLLICLPLAIALINKTETRLVKATKILIFCAVTIAIIGGWLGRNYYYEGRWALSTNSYYNFSIGNAEVYQEDLNLFSPTATREQIAFRKQVLSDQPIPIMVPSSDEIRRQAVDQIKNHKARFLRRALGRLARLFVPRTDALELIGGEARSSGQTLKSVGLFLLTNLQWAMVLVCGVAGLLLLHRTQKQFFGWFVAVIAGAIPLCLIAISKPRYGFVFEPLLLICAIAFLTQPLRNWRRLSSRPKLGFFLLMLFFAWSWGAWLIFAFTSRG